MTEIQDPVIEAKQLRKYFPIRTGLLSRTNKHVRAVDGVSFHIGRGEVVGLVGESGSGKTTVARMLVRLLMPSGGQIFFEGRDISEMRESEFRPLRRRVQMIFQDPFASLNPRMTVGSAIDEALRIHGLASGNAASDRVSELLIQVGLNPGHATRYPHEFSGGQRQRVGIARALAVDPVLLVADEPVSALDVSVQAQVVNLLQDLQQDLGLSMLFVAHDLSIVQHVSDRVIVMYLGKIVEAGPTQSLFRHPRHPYTKALLSAVPVADPRNKTRRQAEVLSGDVPSPINPPSGCVFRTRCPIALAECAVTVPELLPDDAAADSDHVFACINR